MSSGGRTGPNPTHNTNYLARGALRFLEQTHGSMMAGLDQRHSPFRRDLGMTLTPVLPPLNHVPRLLYAALCLIGAISVAGCGTPVSDLRVAPERLDFDYTVSSGGGNGVMQAFAHEGKAILVLDKPLPAGVNSVPVELPGSVRSSADVQGNYVLVPGRPERFIVDLPSGPVEVTRSSSGAIAGRTSVTPSSVSLWSTDAGSEDGAGDEVEDSDEVESNLDWGVADGARAVSDPTMDQGGAVPGRPGHDGEQRRGPLPTSIEQLR